MSASPRQLLIESLRDEIENLLKLQQEAAANRADFAGHTPETLRDLRGVASNLADIYQGAENVFQRILRITREGLPSGAEWHRELLEQMTREVPGVRPPVIRAETGVVLEGFRKFRHLARHTYGFNLKWTAIEPVLHASENAIALLVDDLKAFYIWLEQMPDEDA